MSRALAAEMACLLFVRYDVQILGGDGNLTAKAGMKSDIGQFCGLGRIGVQKLFDPLPLGWSSEDFPASRARLWFARLPGLLDMDQRRWAWDTDSGFRVQELNNGEHFHSVQSITHRNNYFMSIDRAIPQLGRYARSKGKAITSARVFAPAASITRRSKPRATPTAGGRPDCMAASSRLCSGNTGFAFSAAEPVGFSISPQKLLGIQEFVVAVGQFDARDVQFKPFGHGRIVLADAA